MKKGQLLNKLNIAIDSLYDAVYHVRDVLEKYEDEELNEMAQEFVDQIVTCISEGNITHDSLCEYIEECE